MIVVNSSAIAAIAFGEATATALIVRLLSEPAAERKMSAASYIEIGAVMAGRRTSNKAATVLDLDAQLSGLGIELVPVDQVQARIALRARIEFGRGMGRGGLLNHGDCFAYALAKVLNAPLLFIGNDFAATDIVSAR